MTRLPSVAEYMDKNVPTLSPETPILEAIDFLIEKHVTGAPVVNPEGEVVGILTEKDCLMVLALGSDNERPNGRVADFMSRKVVHIPSRMNIYYAAGVFLNHNFRRLPVVDNGRLVGAITRFDILRAVSANHKLVFDVGTTRA